MPWRCGPSCAEAKMKLETHAPFRLDLTVWALRRQAGNRIDTWDGVTYRRCFAFGKTALLAEVQQRGSPARPHLVVDLQGAAADQPRVRAYVITVLRRSLGLDVHLDAFYALASRDPQLAPLAKRYRGLRPPRFPGLFEALANAVACQQVSLPSGIAMLGRLAAVFGQASPQAPGLHAFPDPQDLCGVDPAMLRASGFSRQKADYLVNVAARLRAGELSAAMLGACDDETALRTLSKLRGIKRWSAQYVCLRGLGRLGVFPVDDVGAHRHLAQWMGLPRLDAEATAALVARWQPFAGMVYFHLLLKRLEEGCHLQMAAESSRASPGPAGGI